jgi:hypothetical protein
MGLGWQVQSIEQQIPSGNYGVVPDGRTPRPVVLTIQIFTTPSQTGSQTIPGVNDIKATVREVCNIARRELGRSHLRNGRYLRIRLADRSAERTAVSGNLRKNSRCVTLEPEDSARQILGKHRFRRGQQPLATLALSEQFNAIKDFCLGD